MTTFKERLKELRKEKNLTQKELAEHLKVPQGKISSWENGKLEPNVKMIANLAVELNSSIDYLLGFSDINVNALDIEEQYEKAPTIERRKIQRAFDSSAEYNLLYRRINHGTSYERLYNSEIKLGTSKKEAKKLINKVKKSEIKYLERIQKENLLENSNTLETTHSKSDKIDDNEKY